MTSTEELFDLKNDPLELTNLAADSGATNSLQLMQKRYLEELSNWKKHAVSFNDYTRYGKLFDPELPFDKKTPFLKKKKSAKATAGPSSEK